MPHTPCFCIKRGAPTKKCGTKLLDRKCYPYMILELTTAAALDSGPLQFSDSSVSLLSGSASSPFTAGSWTSGCLVARATGGFLRSPPSSPPITLAFWSIDSQGNMHIYMEKNGETSRLLQPTNQMHNDLWMFLLDNTVASQCEHPVGKDCAATAHLPHCSHMQG